MNTATRGFNLDDLLQKELRRRLGTVEGPSPQPSQSAYHAAFLAGQTAISPFPPSVAFALTRAAAVVLAVALAIVGGSALAAASAGHGNPAAWGKTVTAAVANCMDQLRGEQHGIGQCVSAVARQHGEEERTSHPASAAPANHPGSTPDESGPTGVPNNGQSEQPESRFMKQSKHEVESTGQSESHPEGQSKNHPTAPPEGVPGGPPANRPASGSSHSTRAPSPPPHP